MIYVFKTSVESKRQVENLKPHIEKILSSAHWNFDLEDCDRILRVDSDKNIVLEITDVLSAHQFYCKELE